MVSKKKYMILSFIILIFFCTSLSAYASEFTISAKALTMNIGDTIELAAEGTDQTPYWGSYNVNTAKVDQNGVVTALRKGKTTVFARVGLTYRKCSVKVVDSSIKLNKKSAVIYTGGTSANTVQLKATVKGAAKAIAWTSSKPEISAVDENGKVTSVSAGTAVIVAEANGKTAACEVTVKESSIALNIDTVQLSTKGNGSSIKLTPSITGSQKSVKWTTSDKKIAVVSGGKVTGKKAGTATVTATANGVSAVCSVTVVQGLVSINEEKLLLYEGETKQLKTNAGKKDSIRWTSSNTRAATVENGKITACGQGTTIISVTANGMTDSCEVRVKKINTSVEEGLVFLETKGTDKTYTLKCSVTGRKTSVKWTTSDKNIVSVSKGKLTGKKAGTAIVTATANGVSDTVEVTVRDYAPAITLNQNKYTLYTQKGTAVTLKAAVNGSSKRVVWNSSNPEVADVKNGKVKAAKEGTALITASANGVTDECLITVKESRVVLEAENILLKKGETAELPVKVIGHSQTVTYAAGNKKIAEVKKGLITARNFGETDIKVTANGITSVCHVIVSECEHIFDAGVITAEASCVEKGIKEFRCTKCGYAYTESIPKSEHVWKETEHTAATCTNSGVITYTCENCSSAKQETAPAEGHNYGEWKLVTEPTEFVEGIEKQICTLCKNEIIRMIPKTEHTHTYETVVIEADCTKRGHTIYTCLCGDSYIGDYKNAAGHDWDEWSVLREATETKEGERVRACKKCGEEEHEAIPEIVHEHSYEEVITKKPTCTEYGTKTYTCSCGKKYTEKIPPGHNFVETIISEPTCSKNGYAYTECTVCGAYGGERIVDMLPCDIEEYIKIQPTCTSMGNIAYRCKVCNIEFDSSPEYPEKIIPVLPHEYICRTNESNQVVYECESCFLRCLSFDGWTEKKPPGSFKVTDDIFIRPAETEIILQFDTESRAERNKLEIICSDESAMKLLYDTYDDCYYDEETGFRNTKFQIGIEFAKEADVTVEIKYDGVLIDSRRILVGKNFIDSIKAYMNGDETVLEFYSSEYDKVITAAAAILKEEYSAEKSDLENINNILLRLQNELSNITPQFNVPSLIHGFVDRNGSPTTNARCFSLLMDLLDIPCYEISGDMSGVNVNGKITWNAVYMDAENGKGRQWYYLDPYYGSNNYEHTVAEYNDLYGTGSWNGTIDSIESLVLKAVYSKKLTKLEYIYDSSYSVNEFPLIQ